MSSPGAKLRLAFYILSLVYLRQNLTMISGMVPSLAGRSRWLMEMSSSCRACSESTNCATFIVISFVISPFDDGTP